MELARYVVLNPVRAGMVKHPLKFPWSSYRATVGDTPSPPWFATEALLEHFGQRRAHARRRYAEFVQQGINAGTIWTGLKQQIFLGDEKFVVKMQKKAKVQGDELSIPRAQRRGPPLALATIFGRYRDRNDGIVAAYDTGGYSYREIADYLGLHLATVWRIIRSHTLQGGN